MNLPYANSAQDPSEIFRGKKDSKNNTSFLHVWWNHQALLPDPPSCRTPDQWRIVPQVSQIDFS